jgi:single-strand DNA-binding protein
MFDTYLTIIGNVVSPPRMRMTKNGHAVSNFRIASTSRRFDSEQGAYVDNATLFVNVTCWRGLAENVALSIQKGQPVVVTGRYLQREYKVDETVRVAYELEAIAVGHDLSRGSAVFCKTSRPIGTVQIHLDDEGLPVDDSDRWIDVETGEVVEPPSDPADTDRELAAVG